MVKLRREFKLILFLVIIGYGLAAVSEFWVYHEIQKRLRIEISGQYDPLVLRPSFRVKKASLNWDEKLKVLDGDVVFAYDLRDLLIKNQIRLHVRGEVLRVQFLGDWQKIQGIRETVLNRFDLRFALGPEGMKEIYSLQIDSPEIQFGIKESSIKMA
ncbi:MAG: hypothetical protein JW893_09115 [Candidatus Omnitrophica bacterium]|nr:hypothetical protein [Candidatus Omnitrophota bacterium]